MKFPEYNSQTLEPQILAFWQKHNTTEFLRNRNKNGKPYYFLEGPPYTSGKVHIGTAWQTSMKDIILRYKRMQGFNVWDRMGYDMHGLPTSQKVMKKFNLKNKDDILKFGLSKFTKECEKFCTDMMHVMNKDFERLGLTLDFTDPYQPISQEYMEGIWFLVKKAHEKNRLYQGLRTMHWDAATQSAVAKHELEYKSVKDTSIYVKFQTTDNPQRYFIIWTTTPWTIPLNLAVMVNPNLEYVDVKVGSETWVLAKSLVEAVMEKTKINSFKILKSYKGKELAGQQYNHPLNIKQHLPKELQKNPKLFTVLLTEEYCDDTAGTGLVHSAPGCGPEDYEVGHQNGIPPFNCVNEEGFFKDFGEFTDLKAKIDDNKFIEAIENANALLAKESYVHDYPYGERSHEPVIFRTTKQWFFKVEDLKKKMLAANEKITWNPEGAKNAFRSWLENLRDNSITKQRYWGTPVPIWQAEDDSIVVVESVKELEKLSGQKVKDMHIPNIDKITITKNGKTYKRIPDVLDVWVDAGTASWNCLNFPQKEKDFEKFFPADFILEGKDQIRGWFNLLMVASFLAFDKPSFKNVYMNGFVTDIDGVKMSKSLGNIISPQELIDKHGADVLRYYMFQTNAGEDINFSWDECTVKQRNLMILWNLHKLLINLSKEHNINPTKVGNSKPQIEENYILSKLNSTIQHVTDLLDKHKLDEVITPLEDLYLELSRTYIQLVRDKSSIGSQQEKETVIHTTYTVLLETLKMFHIISPFICEAIYQNLKDEFKLKEESISHFTWPKADKKQIKKSLEKNIDVAKNIIQAALYTREKAKLGLRWPVKEFVIESTHPETVKAVQNVENIIKSQTNAKIITVQKRVAGVTTTITGDPARLGKTFGKDSPTIMKALLATKAETILKQLDKDNSFKVKSFTLTKDMINISKTVPEGFISAETKNATIYLNTARTPELEAEGYARELTRHIQNERKNAGLQKTDEIALTITAEPKLLDSFTKEIKEKCGAASLELTTKPTGKHKSTFKAKNKEFSVGFSKK